MESGADSSNGWWFTLDPGCRARPGPGQGWAEFSDRVRAEVRAWELSLRLQPRLDQAAPSGCGEVSLGSQQIFFDESHWEQLCYPGLTHSKQQSVERLSTGGLLRHCFGGVLLVLEVS